MDDVRLQNKLKLLFEKIVEPDYVMNNYYADGLINKLSNCSDPELSFICTVDFVPDIIIEVIKHTGNAHISVKVFLTRMIGILCHKEIRFTKIFCKQSDIILRGFKEINNTDMNPSLRVAYLEVSLAIVKHNTGIAWLLDTGLWKDILSVINEKMTVFVVRQTYKFATEFLWKLNDLRDQENIKQVIIYILRPLNEVDYMNLETMSSDEEEEKCKTLDPMTHMLISIISKDSRIEQSTLLLSVLLKEIKTTQLYVVIDRIHKEETVILLAKLVIWLTLAKIFMVKPMKPDVQYVAEDFMELTVSYFNIIKFFILRRSATGVLDFCAACTVIWKTVFADKNFEEPVAESDGRKVNLRNQMLFMCLVPIMIFVKNQNSCLYVTKEGHCDGIVKLWNETNEHTAKAAYSLRDLIEELDTLPLVLLGVKKLTSLKHHLNDEQANLVFQTLFYALRQYDPIDDYGEVKQEYSVDDNQEIVFVMTYVMDIVLSLVKNHNINWHESLEVICLYSVVFNILKRPNLTSRFVVTSLNVIAVTVKKFLPPNLSLLLESKPGSSMHELGKLIYMKMHDLQWEIRDSALELLFACTEIAYIKFPPFQKQIMENNLINVAATIAFNDYESYVQVSALKCVGAASKITSIWDHLNVEFPDIQERLLSVFRNNQEGIVRKEACNVLCDLYQNLKLTPAFKTTLYEHMVSSALCDFHWEVQMNALKFWKIVIHSLLNDQGMLDGVFPPVTFSKQSRKIVTLNEAEIQRRLLKILEELKSIGCLTVLVKLLHDDTDVDIMENALCISSELLDILNRYKVPDCLSPKLGEPTNVEQLISQIKEESETLSNSEDMAEEHSAATSDHVIEGILNADDINLLASIYERHMSLQTDIAEVSVKPKIKLSRFASPYLFVMSLKGSDFKAIIEEKRKWNEGIRSVSSLLDDVLGIYEVNDEVNSLDCY